MYIVGNVFVVSTQVYITKRYEQIIITISPHTYSRPQIAYQTMFSSIKNMFSLRKKVESEKKVELHGIKPFTCKANSTTEPLIPYV